MATAVQHFDLPEPTRGVTLEARIGAATWLIDLDHDALETLNDAEMSPGAATVARIMENVKAKAVSMRWFGGGRIALDADDLSLPAPEPIRLDDGSELMPTPWFQIVDIHGRSEVTRRLKSVV
jgi:hypothetical protein